VRVSTLRIAALVACLIGCSGSLAKDAGADADIVCCEITENPVPGGCVSLGGAPREGQYCSGLCDGPNDFVRTIDEFGCPKLVCRVADAASCL